MPYTITKPVITKDYKYKGYYILKVQDYYTQEWYLIPDITTKVSFDTLAEAKTFIREKTYNIERVNPINPEPAEQLFQNFLDQRWNEIEQRFIRNHEHELGFTKEGYPTKRQNELDNLLIQFSKKHPTWQNKVISSK